MNQNQYGTMTRAVDSETIPADSRPGVTLPAHSETDSDERKAQHEILNRLVRAIGPVMRSAQNPALAWAIMEGVFIDQRTVTEICDEMGAPQRTGADYLARFCAALKNVAR